MKQRLIKIRECESAGCIKKALWQWPGSIASRGEAILRNFALFFLCWVNSNGPHPFFSPHRRPVPMADMGPGLRREDADDGGLLSGRFQLNGLGAKCQVRTTSIRNVPP